ncbi:MAG TPA: PrsW family glutamic-type intramembrane protease [Candidatus Eisenbacteria bacterium]|nr:PrsW family glutamic-type intramembrane protease [Candidatus Eisenbacteria bacterium]
MSALTLVLGLAPVVLFLAALILVDSYKLVSRRSIAAALAAGAAAAGVSFLANRLLLAFHLDEIVLRRYVAPLLEESIKAIYLVYLVRSARVGFLVDAAILGFAVGTGFALVENLYYAGTMRDAAAGLWIVRGLGTAVMHGSATAIVGILSKSLTDRRGSGSLGLFLPGIALATAAHALFNHVLLNPFVSTAVMLIAMPLLVGLVYERSDKGTRDWLGVGLDADVELLDSIESGRIADTPVGAYLTSLNRFSGPVVADMLCLLRIHLELSLRAKGILIARAAGVEVPVDIQVRENFQEMKYLERSIGKTGKIAILPFMRTSNRDLWQLYMLGK